jgi:hypothetical protein
MAVRARAAAALVARVEAGPIPKTGRADGVAERNQRSGISGRQGSRLARQFQDDPAVSLALLNVGVVVIAQNAIPLVTSASDNDVEGFGDSHSESVTVPPTGSVVLFPPDAVNEPDHEIELHEIVKGDALAPSVPARLQDVLQESVIDPQVPPVKYRYVNPESVEAEHHRRVTTQLVPVLHRA